MWRFALILLPLPALADSVVATRTIRAHVALSADDMTMVATRVIVYAGKPIHAEDLGPTAIIERNQIIPLSYSVGALSILTEGRALARGGAGEMIEVMNLSSRTKVLGQIGPDGVVHVGPSS